MIILESMNEQKKPAKEIRELPKLTWDPVKNRYKPTRYKKPPKQYSKKPPKTPKQIEENSTPNGSPINLIRNSITNKNNRKKKTVEKTKQLQSTVALAGVFLGMSRMEIKRMTGMSGAMVSRRLSEVLSLDPVVEARERMESYLPLAIQRAIERIEAGDNDLLRDLLKGAGVFQSYHQIRDRSQEATEEQLRASAKDLLLKELRAGAVAVKYTKVTQPRTDTNEQPAISEHPGNISTSSQPHAIETEPAASQDAPDLAEYYQQPPEVDPPAPVTPLPGPSENRLSVSELTDFLGDCSGLSGSCQDGVGGMDSGEVQGGVAESCEVSLSEEMSSDRSSPYGAIISSGEEDIDAAGS